MGQVLHGSARTTEAVRRAIQRSEEGVRALARRHGISPTTVQKWRKRASVSDAPMGPKAIHSTVLTLEEEAMIVAFRRHTLLPLDDCLYSLQPSIPHLTRSALHRCLQRHGISRLPTMEGDQTEKRRFKAYPIGYFHIDIAEVRTGEGKLHLFIDAYNHGRRLKTLRGLTPYEYVARIWTEEPDRFKLDPYHHIAGLNT